MLPNSWIAHKANYIFKKEFMLNVSLEINHDRKGNFGGWNSGAMLLHMPVFEDSKVNSD